MLPGTWIFKPAPDLFELFVSSMTTKSRNFARVRSLTAGWLVGALLFVVASSFVPLIVEMLAWAPLAVAIVEIAKLAAIALGACMLKSWSRLTVGELFWIGTCLSISWPLAPLLAPTAELLLKLANVQYDAARFDMINVLFALLQGILINLWAALRNSRLSSRPS